MRNSLLFFILISTNIFVLSQVTKSSLQIQNKTLKNEIANLNKELQKNKTATNNVVVQYKGLEKKINSRKKIVLNINRQVSILDDEIYKTQLDINKLRREMTSLLKEYQAVLKKSYKNKSLQNKVSFIFSSKNLTQAYRRVKYLEKYTNYQDKQADEILFKRKQIEVEKKKKEKTKNAQIIALEEQKIENEKLQLEIIEQQKILVSYKAKEGEIKSKIVKNKAESKKLDREIQKIIVEEIRLAKLKAEEERKKRIAEQKRKLLELEVEKKKESERIAKTKAEKKEVQKTYTENIKKIESKTFEDNTKEVDLVSDRFESNKGRLPWPVEKGTIVAGFGVTNHPILTNITIENSGIDIGTNSGADARAVFEGTVSAIYAIPGGSKAVLIQHGDYFTVYNNLTSVYVKKGDKVSLKKTIGKIYTDTSTGGTVLNFQVWKGIGKLNPISWIAN